MSNSLALTALSLLLGLFFIFIGLVKVVPKVNEGMYNDWRNEFGRYNKVFPFATLTGWRPYAKNWRVFIGIIEIICGSLLVLIPGRSKTFANIVLLCLMNGALYTHLVLNDPFERIAPSLIFGLLLSCRLIISYQSHTKKNKKVIQQIIKQAIAKDFKESNLENDYFVKNRHGSKLSQIYRDEEEKKIK